MNLLRNVHHDLGKLGDRESHRQTDDISCQTPPPIVTCSLSKLAEAENPTCVVLKPRGLVIPRVGLQRPAGESQATPKYNAHASDLGGGAIPLVKGGEVGESQKP